MDLFAHVYAEQTRQLRDQAAQLRAELDAEAAGHTEDAAGTDGSAEEARP